MKRKIIFEGISKKGKKFHLAYPLESDAQIFCDYINALSQEKTFIRLQGEIINLEEEAKKLNDWLKRIADKKSVELLVFCEEKLVGISAIDMKDKTESHEGSLGISIAKDYRDEGMGEKLMEYILKEAEKNIPQLRIITLGVFSNNPIAKKMYEKFGFKEYGMLPKGILHKGNYVDHIYMYKNIKD